MSDSAPDPRREVGKRNYCRIFNHTLAATVDDSVVVCRNCGKVWGVEDAVWDDSRGVIISNPQTIDPSEIKA